MNRVVLQCFEREALSANLLLLYLFFFLFIFLVIKFKKSKATKYNLPPSPSKLPFIGNLHQLHGSPHHVFRALAQKHGPLMLLHLGRVPTLVVSSSDFAREVMKTYDHVFSSRLELMIPKRLLYGQDIAFAPYGEYWRQLRKVCVLQLFSSKKVQSFRSLREEEIALLMENIKKEASLATSVVNLSEMFVSLTNNIVCRVALGKKYNDDQSERNLKKILNEFTHLMGASNVGDFIPSLAWLNYFNGLNSKLEKNFREIDCFLDEVVEEHIEKKRRINGGDGGGEDEEDDFVDVMLGMENNLTLGIPLARDSTKAIILDMFAAGTDTSSTVLEWAMSELVRHPEIMEEVQNEVRDIAGSKLIIKENGTEEMHYLKAVIKETLRLHPPVPLLLPRESIEKVQVHGYDIPAKTTIVINAYAIGRDILSWEDPDKFLPERFLNGSSASIDYKGQDFQLIPFGAGRRGCPGILFATSILEIALANLLNRFDWALPNGMDGKDLDMHEDSGLTIHRKNELVLMAKPLY
ncbi:hypothetical protein AQUCO_05600025v1 [Aquilegia coerulea]|uniref:Cytochrome P450 n=1 Tax=Aquilegia coerulea TaxID=218851 RepID=A0A2G5CGC6_AQUCA|nr:hypothetical protein AQUCO_05600025v1 [Aquilegia coerulea]